jgi:hypothetical protein
MTAPGVFFKKLSLLFSCDGGADMTAPGFFFNFLYYLVAMVALI